MRQIFFVFFISSIILIECNPTSTQDGTLRFSESANGTQDSIALGKGFEIVLPCNVATGYNWQLYAYDSTIVFHTIKKDTIVPIDTGENAVDGAASMHIFAFTSMQKGRTDIKMYYARWFDNPPLPIDSFSITIVVD